MTIDLPPQYDPKSVEKAIYQKWLDAKAFHAVPESGPRDTWQKQPYSIVIPPPNVTGALHLGHAINGTIQDILTRYHRMLGDNTLWMPGIDHAGIATQAVVEKTIFEKEKKNRHDLGREELVRRIWEWKEQFGTRILSQLQSIGASCDWDRTRFTLDDTCAQAVREAFFKMFKDGLIFRGKRLVNWDTHLQTAVADDEIYHETVKGQMTSIKYPVALDAQPSQTPSETRPLGSVPESSEQTLPHGRGSEQEYLIVATTRPETMLGDTAVAVHPDDPRYKHLHGKFVILPLIGRKIPVICDGQLVDPAFGTGVVKVTPAHDPNDYATGVRHNLEQINLLTPDGKVNDNGQSIAEGFLGKKYSYVGLKFATAARKAVLADLEALGLIADKKVHEHEVGHSDRSKTPIEPYLSDQWFVRMGDITSQTHQSETRLLGSVASQMSDSAPSAQTLPHGRVSEILTPSGVTLADGSRAPGLAQAAIDAVQDGRVHITPERYAKGYVDWLAQKRDWCISRQLWWGHRIPVWHKRYEIAPKTQSNYNPLYDLDEFEGMYDNTGKLYAVAQIVNAQTGEIVRNMRDKEVFSGIYETGGTFDVYMASSDPELFEREFGQIDFVRDPDVLDTWFSSALWPLSTMGWPNSATQSSVLSPQSSSTPEPELLPYFYPTALLSTARDILTLWVARMVIFGLYCRGDVPFRHVFVHPVIQDGEGRIMSKSKGNGVDPVDIINSHGADALRFTLASMATETQDIRMPVVKDPATGANTSPKFDLGRNFANKIWNASRFILSNIALDTPLITHHSSLITHLEDRWILSRLNQTIRATEAAITTYRFADMAEALRTFFWTDLCDWYLEIAKSRIKSGDVQVQSILLHCLRTALKLLHPVMPFITEELWSKLPLETRNSGGGKLENLLITTPWPTPIPLTESSSLSPQSFTDPAAETQLAFIQALTSAIREIQNRYPAAKGKDIILAPRDAAMQQLIEQSRAIIEPLVGARLAENSLTAVKPENAAASVLPNGGGQIFIPGVIDKSAETAKLTKRQAELEKFISSGKAKLNNQAAIAKAPPNVVQGWRDQLAKQEEELAAILKNLAELQ